jgi:organic radical activating enzyme
MNVSNREIAIEIKKYKCNHLVITGGEPLLQQSKLVGLLKMLGESSNICVELETNGTILPRRSLLKLVNYWTVSPKLSSSENLKAKREVRECYELFQSIPTGIFKYAVKDENDLAEIRLLRKKYKVSPDKIILMPQTKSREDLLQKSPWLVEACKQHGYRFSTRLHILLWGNRRGV